MFGFYLPKSIYKTDFALFNYEYSQTDCRSLQKITFFHARHTIVAGYYGFTFVVRVSVRPSVSLFGRLSFVHPSVFLFLDLNGFIYPLILWRSGLESPLGAFHQLLTLSHYDMIKAEYSRFNLLQYGETRSVKHLQFTSWPPDGPPTSSAEMIEFFHKFRSIEPEEDTPIIVHCTYVVQKYLCKLKFCILSIGKTS